MRCCFFCCRSFEVKNFLNYTNCKGWEKLKISQAIVVDIAQNASGAVSEYTPRLNEAGSERTEDV
jgi:hypothetical protein